MKKIKKITTVFIGIIIVMALTVTAMAAGFGGVTWTPPQDYMSSYSIDGGTRQGYDMTDGSHIEVYSFYWDGVSSPHDKTEMEWLDFIEDYYGGYQYMHANMRAICETINGYEYVKITYGPEIEGIRYYDTLYIGGPKCEYGFICENTSPEKPYDAVLRAVVESAQYDDDASATPVVSNPNVPVDDTIKIYVDGNRIYSDADPVIISERTLVPIRAVAEAMGCTVNWDSYTRTVRIQRGDMTVDVIVDDTTILKMWGGGVQEIHADVPATIINSRTFVPIRVVSEAFGAKVDWDANTKSVIIFTHGEG